MERLHVSRFEGAGLQPRRQSLANTWALAPEGMHTSGSEPQIINTVTLHYNKATDKTTAVVE